MVLVEDCQPWKRLLPPNPVSWILEIYCMTSTFSTDPSPQPPELVPSIRILPSFLDWGWGGNVSPELRLVHVCTVARPSLLILSSTLLSKAYVQPSSIPFSVGHWILQ